MRKKLSLILAMLLSFGIVGCNDKDNNPTNDVAYGSLSDAVLWGTTATEKILQDVNGIYDDVKTEAIISVDAAKGEYESKQIIISAKDKKLVYTVETFELQNADGEKFSKENIEVFHEKYLNLTSKYDDTDTPLGR